VKIYLDDVREGPKDCLRLISAPATIEVLHFLKELRGVLGAEEIDLDHDLGICSECLQLPEASYLSGCHHRGTGNDVLVWIEEHAFIDPDYLPPLVRIHTANEAVRSKMEAGAAKINALRAERLPQLKE